ncbi:DUF2075 domain-containing protein [Dellaglioa sp. L3N]
MDKTEPIIEEIAYDKSDLKKFNENLKKENNLKEKYLLKYPTVYIINNQKNEKYTVYVGETTDIVRRTEEHLLESRDGNQWNEFLKSDEAKMFIIGHEHFNKSLTLDIENRLMQYLASANSITNVYNKRINQQNEYYKSEELDSIFSTIWEKLKTRNDKLFPTENSIRNSAIFKASPFHKLTEEQLRIKDNIMLKIVEAITRDKKGQLILVSGEAGAGKTVLMSSLFYELNQTAKEKNHVIFKEDKNFLLVNHDQQLKVYKQIAGKLNMDEKNLVNKPTTFINNHDTDNIADVVIVDEAHLLWTQGKQSYRGKNQLKDLLDRARVVVAVFDENQILSTEQYWENDELYSLKENAIHENNYMFLYNQMRINADQITVDWIRKLVDTQKVNPIKKDTKGYDLKIFDDPQKMYDEIKVKSKDNSIGISRMLATFDWPYINKKNNPNHYMVTIGKFSLPWNLQLPESKEQRKTNKLLSWAEQEQTIGEIGSTFTIQGFDLNYAGVIIGPSVKYRNGKIIFDKDASENKKVTRRRTLKSGKKEYFSDVLLKNELNVLLTRGVNGLYIYAVDDELRQALIDAQRG